MIIRHLNAVISTLAVLLAVLLVVIEIRHVQREWDRAQYDGSYVVIPQLASETSSLDR
ncbi:hypothetical protein [Singulisphaera sp. PoT]|uniref:hypothetical protein n=1 Tax=Singulisphaera sp. PoT TaxID=3411797 RepID=UPI003BF5DBD5